MIVQTEVKNKLSNLQKLIDNIASNLDLCNNNTTIPHFTDGLVNEIHHCTKDINRLDEEVKKGNITKEMARIDINYWMNEKIWEAAKKLYDAKNYPEGSVAHERLREALKLMQESLGGLKYNLLDAPKECYLRFFKQCYVEAGLQQARLDFKDFMANYLCKDDLLQSYQHYLQKILYIFYQRDFLRYDFCPLQNPRGYKFNFDFDLISSEVKESSETIRFCKRVNHYLIMPDKYTVHLNTEKLGKYLFDNYVHLTKRDFISISYLDEGLKLYNPRMKEVVLQVSELNDQPAAEELNYFAPMKNLQTLLSRSWFSEVRMKEAYDQAWTDAFVEALMASEWRDDIARQWAATGQRSKVKQIKGYVLGLLADACVLRGSYNQIATKAGITDDPRIFSRYMAEGKRQPYAQWVMRYITEH